MQLEQTVVLGLPVTTLDDPMSFILDLCAGKRVLNVGATGNVERYVQLGHLECWLQYRLSRVAASLTGIDIDHESLKFAQQHGYDVQFGDCTQTRFDELFDVIVVGDVIEHVGSPGAAMENLLTQLAPGGVMLISTPNPTYLPYVVKAMFGKNLGIYYDHVSAFFPENLMVLCQRLGGRVEELRFFTPDEFRPGYKLRSMLLRLIGKLFPRFNSSFMILATRD